MTSRWNPSNPDRSGGEWYGSNAGVLSLASLVGRGSSIVSTATESVDTIATIVRNVGGTDSVLLGVDVYDLANPVVDTQSWALCLPATNLSNAAGWVKSASGVETAYDSNAHNNVAKNLPSSASLGGDLTATGSISTTTLTLASAFLYPLTASDVGSLVTGAGVSAGTRITAVASPTSATVSVSQTVGSTALTRSRTAMQLRYQGVDPSTAPQIRFYAGNTFYDGDTGAGGASITGKRISSVEVVAVVENDTLHSVRFAGQLVIGGVAFNADTGQVVIGPSSGLVRVRFAFYNNPATGLPWTNADAVALTNGTNGFGVAVITKIGAGNFIVTALNLQFRVCTERRVATGYSNSSSPDEWVAFTLLAPADNSISAWSKVSGHSYLLLYSLTRGSGSGGLSALDSSNVAGHETDALTGADVRAWNLDHSAVPLSLVGTSPGQIPAVLYISGTASVDSLPYGDVKVVQAGASGAVHKQGISTGSAQAYGTATVLVGTTTSDGGVQDAGLTVTLKKTSDNSTLAGPVTINASDVPQDGKYHPVTVRFGTPATLTAAEAVYLELQSTSTVSWFLPGMISRTAAISSSDATALSAAAAGQGGTTDKGDSDSTLDFPWSIGVAPSPPGTLASSALTQANQPALTDATVPKTIGYAHLTWAVTSLGANFGYYEVQRQEPDSTWVTLYQITSEVVTHANDIEPVRNTALAYRIRVVRADGGFSAWASFPSVTIPTVSKNDVVIASNYAASLSLAFADVTSGPHAWTQLRDAQTVNRPIYGADFPATFAGSEDGGEEFTRDLLVAVDDPTFGVSVTQDRAIFDPSIALFKSSLPPALAYCDGYGRRWLVSIKASPSTTGADGAYIATVVCTQVASAVAPIVTSAPW